MRYESHDTERESVITVAGLMLAAARTAPKGKGVDCIEAVILDGEEKAELVQEMKRMAAETGVSSFDRDGTNIDNSVCIIIMGVRNEYFGTSPCGNCGFKNCAEAAKTGAMCGFKNIDLGIALGSAVSVAALHHIDTRIMYTAGQAAKNLTLLSPDVDVYFGIPLSATGKSIYFDR